MRNAIPVASAALFGLFFALSAGQARAAGNAAAGALIFEDECLECHATSGKNKKGPSLRGIIGRKAGSAAGFADYSEPLKNSSLVWTAEELDKYLTKPKQFSPNIRMKYEGLGDAKARADLIEFLTTKK
jgi:cytochrome c